MGLPDTSRQSAADGFVKIRQNRIGEYDDETP